MGRRFWAAVALQVAILLGIVGLHSYTLLTGRTVMLQSVSVDPWDPFRGEYVALQYAISQVETSAAVEGWPYEAGQRVWVTLRQGDPYWTAVALSDRRPVTAPNEVALRGRIVWIDPPDGMRPGRVGLRYGIEQFFVPEGQGQELEGRRVEMAIEARVDSRGRAAIHTVYLEGEPIEWR